MANPIVVAVIVGCGLALTLYYLLRSSEEPPHNYGSSSGRSGNRRDSDFKSSHCSICLDHVSMHSRILKCGHMFHSSCIDTWLQSHRNCPNCRSSV